MWRRSEIFISFLMEEVCQWTSFPATHLLVHSHIVRESPKECLPPISQLIQESGVWGCTSRVGGHVASCERSPPYTCSYCREMEEDQMMEAMINKMGEDQQILIEIVHWNCSEAEIQLLFRYELNLHIICAPFFPFTPPSLFPLVSFALSCPCFVLSFSLSLTLSLFFYHSPFASSLFSPYTLLFPSYVPLSPPSLLFCPLFFLPPPPTPSFLPHLILPSLFLFPFLFIFLILPLPLSFSPSITAPCLHPARHHQGHGLWPEEEKAIQPLQAREVARWQVKVNGAVRWHKDVFIKLPCTRFSLSVPTSCLSDQRIIQ